MRKSTHTIAGAVIIIVCLMGSVVFAATPGNAASTEAVVTAKVEGVVKDLDSGKVIKNALVTVTGCKKSAMTNSAGKFYLEDVPANSTNLQVTKRGYQTLHGEIELTGEKKLSLKIKLEAEKKAEVKPVAGITTG